MATVEQIAAIVEAILKSTGGGGMGGGRERRNWTMDERHSRRMTVLSGDDHACRDWSFQLRPAIRGTERGVFGVISWVELAPSEIKKSPRSNNGELNSTTSCARCRRARP